MSVLLAHPGCAMCHAAGLVFTATNQVIHVYPPEHRLDATDPDPVERARHVMQRYTSAPVSGVSTVAPRWISCPPSAIARASTMRSWPSWRCRASCGMCRSRCTGGAAVANP